MDFQWPLRIVNGLLPRWRHLAGARLAELHGNGMVKQKGRREAGLS
jgi:hypothetical protein